MKNAIVIAKTAFEQHWNGVVPVDIEAIARKMGVDVRYSRGIDGDVDISGKFYYENNLPVCVVNCYDTEQRQRFTLAHELGHFVLGHGNKIDRTESLYRNPNGYQDYSEFQANAFAAELLMPKILVDFLIEEKNIVSVERLAEKLNVSQIAMKYRLKNIGWL